MRVNVIRPRLSLADAVARGFPLLRQNLRSRSPRGRGSRPDCGCAIRLAGPGRRPPMTWLRWWHPTSHAVAALRPYHRRHAAEAQHWPRMSISVTGAFWTLSSGSRAHEAGRHRSSTPFEFRSSMCLRGEQLLGYQQPASKTNLRATAPGHRSCLRGVDRHQGRRFHAHRLRQLPAVIARVAVIS